ncbi:hypothetical protein [Gardnerella vaginalis]|uniref:hypothetical protein n=1 Tax=Gardnerella vaginalis TaxID=2702 RepID=UPI00280ABF85|nr:hypothetical protein [Gardnerella vaginalis]
MHERLKHNSRMHFDSLSLLKVESTLCFQRKRSTLTSCALDPRALISSLKQKNRTQKSREHSLKPLRIKPFNDSPR